MAPQAAHSTRSFVQARFTFDNGGGNLVFDTGLEALPPAQLTGTGHPWLQGTPNGPACTPTFVPGHSTPNDPCCPESCHSSFGTAPHDHCVRPPECPSCDPSGACCTTGGGCTDGLTSAHCGAIGGSYGGDNTTCAGTNCSPSIGACCLTSGVCIDGQSPGGCSSQSGTYQGDGSSCATVTCPTFVCVPAGADCWTTACPGSNYSFLQSPLPAGFFGPGSDPFTGLVTLGGSPSGPFGSDTVIQRLGDLCFPQPIPSSATVPIELVALSLVSCQPITVTYNGGQNPEQWNIAVGLSPTPAPNGTLTGTMLTPTGGTFDSVLFVQPVFTFNRVVLPATVVLDTGAAGIPPMQIGSTGAPWTTNPISGPSCSPGFHPGYTDEPVPCCPETCHSSFGTAPHDHCVRPSECPHCTPATPNDDCGTAIPLSIGSFVTGSNAAAADDVSPPACGVGTPNQGVWYSVIGNGDLLTLSTCNPGTDFDTMVEVFNGSCVAPVCVGGNDDAQPPGDPACSVAGSNLKSRFTFCSQAGVNYLIRVSGFGTNSGTLELSVSDAGPCLVPPPNDSCAVPIVIGEGLTSFSTVNATTDGPTHSAAECQYARPVYNNIWFQYTASCSGNLRVTDCAELGGSSNYDSRIAVYGTTDCAQLEFNLVGCNDDDTVNPCGDSPLFHSTVDAPVVAGVTYLISVGSFSPTGSGSGTLSVTCDSGSGLGACCVGASCSDGWDSIGCSNSGGAYQGNGSNCGTVICLPPGFGACCIGVDCSEGWDEPSCMSNGGSFLGDARPVFRASGRIRRMLLWTIVWRWI
ncbi:MAG: hypothetical protein IPK83_00965 [Planctomycetes bacterium]|nr:hypothetical protein [Planctomycetota bacterium]